MGMCYAAGALYGMNRIGLAQINKYFDSHPNITGEKHMANNANLMKHEDFMVSYVYREATGYPVVMNNEFFQFGINTSGLGSKSNPPICYHKVMYEKAFYEYYTLFYKKSKGQLRNI